MDSLKRIFNLNLRSRKGNQRLIFIVAMMALAVMFIALWFTAMESWVMDSGDQFIKLATGEGSNG